jgi:hypothetical protein
VLRAVANDGKGSGVLYLGFEIASLQRFLDHPLDTMVPVKAADVGLAYSTLVFSGPDRTTLRRAKAALKLNPHLSGWSLVGLDVHTLVRLQEKPLDYVLNMDTKKRGFSHELRIFSGTTLVEMQNFMMRSGISAA